MPDWKAAAAAFAPDVPEEQIDRITPALNYLESTFRPLVKDIPVETEPACVFLINE
jgi:hypothetical protein